VTCRPAAAWESTQCTDHRMPRCLRDLPLAVLIELPTCDRRTDGHEAAVHTALAP